VSSTYALGEAKRFLRDAATLHSLLLFAPDLQTAFHQLASKKKLPAYQETALSWPLLTERRRDHYQTLLANVCDPRRFDREEAVRRLRRMLRGSFERALCRLTGEWLDQTECRVADRRPHREDRAFRISLGCTDPAGRCRIAEFWEARRDELAQIVTALEDAPDGSPLAKLRDKGQEILDGSDGWGQPNCWPMGDAILACECPQDVEVCTTNLRDFEPICEAIGKRCFSYEQQERLPFDDQ
jgi:hypothetical protein